jgi:uncharacterized membrane protein YphA (DoxX/SURF4 family)/peroxiredoxin
VNTVLIVARLALGAVFLVAAIAKLADMPGSRVALEGFGVTPALVPVAALALPAVEITCVVLLGLASTARVGAALAVALLLTFVAAIFVALRRGSAPDCHCFGQLHSRPAGKETIGRNGVLAAIGLYVLVAGPGPGLGSWLSDSNGDVLALAGTSLVGVVLAYTCLSLWRENRKLTGRARLPEASPALEVGDPMPGFRVASDKGAEVHSEQLMSDEKTTIFVFTSATCGPCVGLLPELARWREMLFGRLGIHVLASGDPAENRRLSTENGMPVFLDQAGDVAAAFGISATPSAVEIDAGGRVATRPAVGAPAIEGLIRAALKRPPDPTSLPVHHVGGKPPARTLGVAS